MILCFGPSLRLSFQRGSPASGHNLSPAGVAWQCIVRRDIDSVPWTRTPPGESETMNDIPMIAMLGHIASG
jgi:hypothetical protein